jgi:hypothetical protein
LDLLESRVQVSKEVLCWGTKTIDVSFSQTKSKKIHLFSEVLSKASTKLVSNFAPLTFHRKATQFVFVGRWKMNFKQRPSKRNWILRFIGIVGNCLLVIRGKHGIEFFGENKGRDRLKK